MKASRAWVSACVVIGLWAGTAVAVTIATVPVGDPGNVADTYIHSNNPAGQGAVAYNYRIGTYEVTASQYCEFLNAKAKTDPYGLYNTQMWNDTTYGCRIQQSSTSGDYTYSVASGYANRPVNYVSYWDSCRFANWLNNGQGNGDTETGTYTLTPAGIANNTVTRNAGAMWAVTSENEWYKAAYYNPATSSYYDYPTSSNSINTGMANYNGSVGHTTDVGSYGNASPYGTFDQGGNVWEWNESIAYLSSTFSTRRSRGGSFLRYDDYLHAWDRGYVSYTTSEDSSIGFRVSYVPEPATLGLMALASLGVLRKRRGR